MAWSTEENTDVAVAGVVTTFEVNGNIFDVEVDIDLKELVLKYAREAGYGKFRFYIDDVEVLPQDAPESTVAGSAYKITPYDVAG